MTDVPAHTVVVGVDGSPTSERAVVWAAEQARLEGRDLTLVHATDAAGATTLLWLDQAGLDSTAVVQAARDDAERLLAATADRVAGLAPGVRVRGVVADLDPREALHELAHEAALVVVGSRGRGPVSSLLLGSVAHALSREPVCPLVVVRPTDGTQPRQGVLVGVDESGGSPRALDFAYRQASLRGQHLQVVHCLWDARAASGDVGPEDEGYDAERRLLAEIVAGMTERYPDVVVRTVLTRGMVDRTLVRLGEAAELVVVGTHTRRRASGLVRGRTASVVTEQSSSIVAVVPEPTG